MARYERAMNHPERKDCREKRNERIIYQDCPIRQHSPAEVPV